MNWKLHWAQALVITTVAAAVAAQKTPDEALRALAAGNHRFATDKSVSQPVGEGVRRTLARGQSPFAIVLCCSDSRVPPEHIFNCGLGELFVVRIAGNTCDRETLASIEYAVEHLNVPLCVVLGHEHCGAVAAAINQVQAIDMDHVQPAQSQAVQSLLEHIEPAVRKARARDLGGKELSDACEEENAHLCLHECMRRSPLLRRYVQVGKLQMVAARYHLDDGKVEWLPNRPLPPEPRAGQDQAMLTVPIGVPPHVALRMLQAGHRRFLGDSLPAGDLTAARRDALTHGQQPLAIVLACADSRVAPEHVFDSGLGELVVVRVAGNVVTEDVLASIEQAAGETGASLLLVMGHTRCGAVTAATKNPEGQQLSPNMRALLEQLEPAVEKARGQGRPEDLVDLAVRANVLRAANEARSRSSLLRELEKKGRFAILPVVYDIASGDLSWLKDAPEQQAEAAPAGETAPVQHTTEPGSHGNAKATEPTGNGHGEHSAGGTETAVMSWADSVVGPGAQPPAVGHANDNSHGHEPKTPIATPRSSHGEPAKDGPHSSHGNEVKAHADPHVAQDAHGAGNHAPVSDPTTGSHGAAGAKSQPEPHATGGHSDTHGGQDEHDHPITARAGSEDAPKSPWLDPIVLVGASGVASLLLAALIAIVKR